jgi:Glycosyl hydrolases family 16
VTAQRSSLDEAFDGDELDLDVWFPYYLPHWSSRATSAATYQLSDGGLRLSIPADQPRWCPDDHPEPLRVSCIQSGSLAGPLGSTVGQQPFRPGLVVREEQPTFFGYTPHFGHVEIRMRGVVTARSMFAFWLSGIEDEPEHSGEICVAEIFGDAIGDRTAAVGMGVHSFRDPSLHEDFSADLQDVDVTEFHTYGVDWTPEGAVFAIDGREVRVSDQSPDYPLQLMIGVFDFPAKATEHDTQGAVPEMLVSHVRGWTSPASR